MFKSEQDWRNPASLTKLPLAYSALRESLRRNPINMRGLLRGVVHEDGMKLPDGNHVAKGSWLGPPQRNVHMDERFYSNPDEYQPFRFINKMASEDKAGLSRKSSHQRKNVLYEPQVTSP